MQNPAFDAIILSPKEMKENELYLRRHVNGTDSGPNCLMNQFSLQNSEQNIRSTFFEVLSGHIPPYLQYCPGKIISYTGIYDRICSHMLCWTGATLNLLINSYTIC